MDQTRTFLFESPYTDPWRNLAIEEHLLSFLSGEEVILYLWQNEHTVVIGRNQNAWKECRTSLLSEEGGSVARRLSGGGAVYHDLGNQNFTFLASPSKYDFERHLKVLVNAFRSLDIPASFSGRNDIIVDNRKVSGNAFYMGKKGRFHHGAILVDVDVEKLVRYLQPPAAKLKAKGIDSVRSRVANLKEFNPSISTRSLKNAIADSFLEEYGGEGVRLNLDGQKDRESIQELYGKYSSEEWIFGRTPDFDLDTEKHFQWGNVEIGLHVSGGMIKDGQIYSDAMKGELIAGISPVFSNVPLDGKLIARNLRNMHCCPVPAEIEDIAGWLETEWDSIL